MPDDAKQQLVKELLSLLQEQGNDTPPEPTPDADESPAEQMNGVWDPEPEETPTKVRKNYYIDLDVARCIEAYADGLPKTSMSRLVNHVMRTFLQNRGTL